MNTKNTPPPNNYQKHAAKDSRTQYSRNNEIQSLHDELKNPPQVNDCSTQSYLENTADRNPVSGCSKGSATAGDMPTSDNPTNGNPAGSGDSGSGNQGSGLSQVQQQFVLRFCRQLASVIAACEQSESAEIEVGRRHVDTSQIKVKLQAEREYSDKST